MIKFTLSALMIAALVACGGGGGSTVAVQSTAASAPTPAGLILSANISASDLTCTDYAEYTAQPARYANNVWNKQAAGSYPYEQCLRQRGAIATKELGWRWNWPSNSNSVYGYPEVVAGWKPWNGGKSTTAYLPINIAKINKFTWAYTVETASNGKYNLATSMWLTSDGQVYKNPNASHVTTEFMIWTDGFDFHPAGTLQGLTEIDGNIFEVWFAPIQRDASGQNSNSWKYIAYRLVSQKLSITLDIKKILNNAAALGLVLPTEYVSNIELGNEVMSGSGETWIKSLTLDIQ